MSNYSNDFFSLTSIFLKTKGCKHHIWELVDIWKAFVEECSEGYGMSIYEYDNDLSVRFFIDSILLNEEFNRFSEFTLFKEKVLRLDEIFQSICLDSVRGDYSDPWFYRCLPKTGCEEFLNDISRYQNYPSKI